MQVILGSSGVIGKHVAFELSRMKEPVRLVARNPVALSDTNEVFKGNLLVEADVMNAIAGCTVAYVTVGLPYHSKVWERDWPILMQHVVHACIASSCKLVFFDNVYAYGKVEGWMTEQTPMLATSRKGLVRKRIAEMIFDAVEKKGLQAMIVRAPDFYGPHTPLSFLNLMLFERMLKHKSPQVMLSAKRLHSFIYTPDAGRATAFLRKSIISIQSDLASSNRSVNNEFRRMGPDNWKATFRRFINTSTTKMGFTIFRNFYQPYKRINGAAVSK